jgi:predicted lipoprotein
VNHPFVQTYDLYLAAWSEASTVKRESVLNRRLSERVLFANPQQKNSGKRSVAKYLEDF